MSEPKFSVRESNEYTEAPNSTISLMQTPMAVVIRQKFSQRRVVHTRLPKEFQCTAIKSSMPLHVTKKALWLYITCYIHLINFKITES